MNAQPYHNPFNRLTATPAVRSFVDPSVRHLVYSIRRNRVGILQNFITDYGSSIGVDSSEDDLIVIATEADYLRFVMEWSLRHTRGYTGFLSLNQYAERYKLRPYHVRKFVHTALAYALGVRQVGDQFSIPEELPPRLWLELRRKQKESKEVIRRKFILSYLRQNGETLVRELVDMLVGHSRSICRKTIKAMVDEGTLTRRGAYAKSRVRLNFRA